MKWIPVKSSNIEAIAWVPGAGDVRGFLFVRFIKSGVYHYIDVPKDLFEEMLNADSVGSFFAARIKNEFDFVKGE